VQGLTQLIVSGQLIGRTKRSRVDARYTGQKNLRRNVGARLARWFCIIHPAQQGNEASASPSLATWCEALWRTKFNSATANGMIAD
jgi:hypothetical protein